jgi:Tfp pilus assembly protein PilN
VFRIDLKKSAHRAEAIAAGSADAVAGAFVPVAVAVVALVLALWAIDARWDASLANRRAEVEQLQSTVNETRQRLVDISGKRRALLRMDQPEIYWSDQLRLLSERLPDKIWISRVAVATSPGIEGAPPSRQLAIEGGVLSSESEANLDLIGQFIRTLQSDPRFQVAFADIHLESVTRGGDDAYTLNFVLKAPFRA